MRFDFNRNRFINNINLYTRGNTMKIYQEIESVTMASTYELESVSFHKMPKLMDISYEDGYIEPEYMLLISLSAVMVGIRAVKSGNCRKNLSIKSRKL